MFLRENRSEYFRAHPYHTLFGIVPRVFLSFLLMLAITLAVTVVFPKWAEERDAEKTAESTISGEEAAEAEFPAAWLDRLFRHGDTLAGGWATYDVTEDSIDFFGYRLKDIRYYYWGIPYGAEEPTQGIAAGSGIPGAFVTKNDGTRLLLSVDDSGRLAVQRTSKISYVAPADAPPAPEDIMALLAGGDLSLLDLQLVLTAVRSGNLIGCHDGVAWWMETGDEHEFTLKRLTSERMETVYEDTADSALPAMVIANTALLYEDEGRIALVNLDSGSITYTEITIDGQLHPIIAYNYCYRDEDVVVGMLTADKVMVAYYRPGEADFDYGVYDDAVTEALSGPQTPGIWVGIGTRADSSSGIVVYYGNGQSYGNRVWLFRED